MPLISKLKELEEANRGYKNLRYFDCAGHPDACDVFLTGINPATGLPAGKEFWAYWKDDIGFELERYLKEYTAERKNRLKKKTEMSPTRNRIETLRKKLKTRGHRMLNCNIYTRQTSSANELTALDKNLDVFFLLLTELKPKFLIFHGKQPKTILHLIAENVSSGIIQWEPFPIEFKNFKSQAICVPHLFNMAMSREKNEARNIDLITDKLFA